MKENKAQAAFSRAEEVARRFLIDTKPKQGHVLLSEILRDEVLSPPTLGRDPPDRALFGTINQPAEYDDEKGKKLIERAMGGDKAADAALCAIACKHILFGQKMQSGLTRYIAWILILRMGERGSRRRGADPYANVARNMYIVSIVSELVREGFHATRNKASRERGGAESACSIVANVLGKIGVCITEDGVEEVWSQRETFGFPRKRAITRRSVTKPV